MTINHSVERMSKRWKGRAAFDGVNRDHYFERTIDHRSQANTAKLLDGSPTLMRLRELEVLEKVATSGKLNVVLGETGLVERVVNLL